MSARAGCVWWSARLVSACKGLRSFDGLEVEEWEKNVKIPDHHLQLEKKASTHTCRAWTCASAPSSSSSPHSLTNDPSMLPADPVDVEHGRGAGPQGVLHAAGAQRG